MPCPTVNIEALSLEMPAGGQRSQWTRSQDSNVHPTLERGVRVVLDDRPRIVVGEANRGRKKEKTVERVALVIIDGATERCFFDRNS